MNERHAIAGKILVVDLSSGSVHHEPTAPLADRLLGGLGVSTYELLARMPAETRPFDDASVLTFGAGALVGTTAPSASRISVAGLNPYNGGFGSTSAGGAFAPELKFAGYDTIVVTGKATHPVYLFIEDDQIAIEDARDLWGATTWQTIERIHDRHGAPRPEVLAIGPAGENRLPSANVIVTWARAAARCGQGAVMGAKNLKAIAVRGRGGISVHDPEGFMAACHEIGSRLRRTHTARKLRTFGTPVSFRKWNEQGAVPVRNFQRTQMAAERAESLSAERLKQDHIRRGFACYACTTPCSQFVEVRNGPYAGADGEKIESQNLWDFGTKLDVSDLSAVLKASRLCTQFGLDVSTTSGVIGWAFECFEKGLLTVHETGGLKLEWGDHGVIISLIERIARQSDDFARLLGQGAKQAAERLGKGSDRLAQHVKGQDLAEELRPFKGWTLGIAVAERAGTHTQGAPLTERMGLDEQTSERLFGVTTASQPQTYEGKARLVAYYQRFHAAMEGIGVCFFSSNWMGPHMLGPSDYVDLFNLATGSDITVADFLNHGERIHTLQKLVNIKHAGLRREHDWPPARAFDEAASGPQSGEKLDREKWSALLDEYYAAHDWDRASGRPTRTTLHTLGLSEFDTLL